MAFTRVVIDTNVVLSGLLFPRSNTALALHRATLESALLISQQTLAELEEVILRPKFDRYFDLMARTRQLDRYLLLTSLIEVTHTITACRDPRDNKFLELALSGRADLILTGDTDLLGLHPWNNIAILSPADYLAR